jgi:rhomboid family GlyGly-CTERM serine protease
MAEKKSQSIKVRYPIFTLLILSVSVLSFFSPKISLMLIFDRSAVIQGEVWRMFSSHFVHFTDMQLVYNLLVFSIAGWIIERKSHLHFVFLYISMALVISITLFILKPAMIYYGGLSGLACGFIFYCALLGITEPGPWRIICKLIVFFLPIKILLELYNSASILPYWGQQTFVIMPISHISGTVVALLFYFVLRYSNGYSGHRFSDNLQPYRFNNHS